MSTYNLPGDYGARSTDEARKKLGGAEDLAVVWRERAQLAERDKGRLLKVVAWYWRAYGPYPSAVDEEPS